MGDSNESFLFSTIVTDLDELVQMSHINISVHYKKYPMLERSSACLWPPCPLGPNPHTAFFCTDHELIMRANGYEPAKKSPEETGDDR